MPHLPDGGGVFVQPPDSALSLHRQPAVRPPGMHQKVASLKNQLR